MKKSKLFAFLCLLTILVLAFFCFPTNKSVETKVNAETPEVKSTPKIEPKKNPNNDLFWGDTHLHTATSPDAYAEGARLSAEDAYRFARGEEVMGNDGKKKWKLARPLDFLVVADHAEGYGLVQELLDGNPILMKEPTLAKWAEMFRQGGEEAHKAGADMPQAVGAGRLDTKIVNPMTLGPIFMKKWRQYLQSADKYNEPGKFTALAGFEWSSMPQGNNLHRVVVFRDGYDRASQVIPYSSFQSNKPEDLWKYLQNYEAKTGGKVLAIPHNGNLSNGRMFSLTDSNGNSISKDYAELRSSWEPVVETTQTKGDSESHPTLSPNDEFASFGDFGWDRGNMTMTEKKTPEMLKGDYSREALKNGILFQDKLDANPYKFGLIGSTDSHTGLSTSDANNWSGKFGSMENDPNRANKVDRFFDNNAGARMDWHYLSSGYAAVWAASNTREDIWDALKRREVYGTTGPRIQLRFFGGWNFKKGDEKKADYVSNAYKNGVPMGSDLTTATGKAPKFIVVASKDALGANLDRIQIIKGWVKDGKTYEKVFNVAWSGKRKLDKDGKIPAVGNTVNAENATYTNAIGAKELAVVWTDPEFDASLNAFYYVRVLEIPTTRWTTYDAVREKLKLLPEIPTSEQQRAYSSPIWFTPPKK